MDELFKIAINGGVGVVLAYVVLRWQRSDAKDRAEECKHCAIQAKAWAVQERDDKQILMDVVQANTKATTELTEVIRNLVEQTGGRER